MDGPLPPREGPSFLTFEERGELYGLPVCASAGDDNSPRPRERKRESSRGSSFLGGLPRFRLNTAPAQQLISHGDYYQRGWFASLAAQPEPDDMASFYPLGHLSSDGDSLSELLRDDQRVICWLCAAQAACAGGYLLLQWGEEILGDAWQREAVFFFTAAACLASSLVGLAGARWRSRQLLNWYLMSQFFAASSVLQQTIRDASESEGHRVWCSEDDVDVQHNEDGAVPRRATPRRAAPRRAAPRTRTLCLASRPRIVDAHPASVRPSHGLQNPATRAGEVCGFLGFVERLLLLGCFSVVCASIYFASEMVEALQEKIERNNTAQIVRFVWRMQRNSAQVLDRFEQRVHGGFEGGLGSPLPSICALAPPTSAPSNEHL